MSLPILTTTDDVQSIVSFLRNKPTGATLAETRAALGGAAVDGRKLSAYQFWQIVKKETDRMINASFYYGTNSLMSLPTCRGCIAANLKVMI